MKLGIQNKITKCDLLVIPFYEGKKPSDSQNITLEYQFQGDFEGKMDEQVMLYPKNKITPRILLVGLGKLKESSLERWRRAGGLAAKMIKKPIQTVTVVPAKEDSDLIGAFVEGFLLAHYQYETFLTKEDRKLHTATSLQIVVENKTLQKNLASRLKEIEAIIAAVHATRDMINAPSNVMSPRIIAKTAQSTARKHSHLKCKIFDEKKIAKLGMECLIGVGSGAKEPPRLIVMEYKYNAKNKKPIVLIGKGICFDSGGINLKRSNLVEMKSDMTGAATVLNVMGLVAQKKLSLHVIAIMACAENMVGSNATKPGDIHRNLNGTTVEITNTDAEGRLVLCDAIAYGVKHYKPEAIVDMATLTGAAIVALGRNITALMSTNKGLARQLKAAAEATDESVWELPCEESYKKYLKSPIADVCNYNEKPSAGTIMGGLFLEYFTDGTPWAHLDVGGTAWNEETHPYIPKGATGRHVRSLFKFLQDYVSPEA